jgi:hypothetical protein
LTPKARELWLKCAKDPNLFARTFLPKKPHKGQALWLTMSVQPINTLVPGNRWGKSTIIAEKHIWSCIFKVGIKVKTRAGDIRCELAAGSNVDPIVAPVEDEHGG